MWIREGGATNGAVGFSRSVEVKYVQKTCMTVSSRKCNLTPL